MVKVNVRSIFCRVTKEVFNISKFNQIRQKVLELICKRKQEFTDVLQVTLFMYS